MSLLILGVVSQAVLAAGADALWWVPDLLTAALVLGIIRQPGRWAALSAAAAVCAMVWAVRDAPVAALSCLALGWGVRTAVRHWDLGDPRLQGMLVAAASAAVTGVAVWSDDLWSLPVAGWWLVRCAVTGLIAWRWAARGRRGAWPPG